MIIEALRGFAFPVIAQKFVVTRPIHLLQYWNIACNS